MTEQRYRVIADRDKGDDPRWTDVQGGDRYVGIAAERANQNDSVVRIERPVPTPDAESGVKTIREFKGDDVWRDERGTMWVRFEELTLAVKSALISQPSRPTREQIADLLWSEAAEDGDDPRWTWAYLTERADRHEGDYAEIRAEYYRTADAVLALFQNGADR